VRGCRTGGRVFAGRGRFELVDLATCRVLVLARVMAASMRFSPDGRWLAYARQANGIPSHVAVRKTWRIDGPELHRAAARPATYLAHGATRRR
jgi:hypothetical protein